MRVEPVLRFLPAFLLFLFMIPLASAQQQAVQAYEFYSLGCIHCAEVERYLINLEREYPQLNVTTFEISYSGENMLLSKRFCIAYGVDCSERPPTPLVFINDTYISGDVPIKEKLKPIVEACIRDGCVDAAEKVEGVTVTELHSEPPILVVVLAAMVDSINPCAFAVLIFMLQYIGSIASRHRMINVGLVYISVVYVTYLLAGLGILASFQSLSMTDLVYKLAAILALVAGIINIKDYFFYGKWISLEIPKKYGKTVEKYVQQATLPAAVALGVLVSAVELPCTGGAYFAILAMLQWAPFWKAFTYLALYNFFFVLPLIIILILFTLGYSSDALEKMRLENRRYMRLGIGLLLFFLGLGMLMGWFTGGFWST
ncbi:MAG: cytochrome c biogenesis protein CcdA [Candidatus Micrarchaeota archaeon]